MYEIETRIDQERGCGWRKPGGLYLVSGDLAAPCGKLPVPLHVCPACGTGIKPSRGWTWVNGTALLADHKCHYPRWSLEERRPTCTALCPMFTGNTADGPIGPGRVGLLWVGGQFYSTPAEFTAEAAQQGVSRRISAIPRDFQLGHTWVWFAHRKAIENPDGSFTAGVFHTFKPVAIEYVVKDDDPADKLERLAERGITLVRIERATDSAPLLEV